MIQLTREYRRLRKAWLAEISPDARACASCGTPVWSPEWGTWFGNPKRIATVEHVIPRCQGGSERDTDNFALFCWQCNQDGSQPRRGQMANADQPKSKGFT